MSLRTVVLVAALVALAACQQAGPTAGIVQNPAAPSAAAASSDSRPWKATMEFRAAGVQWAGQPGVDTSTFGGRCSVMSDYVITVAFKGEATHAGRFTGGGSHCTQISWTPAGPGGVAYSDGRGTLTAANGSTLTLEWGDGVSGVDPTTGKLWFKDTFTFTGGTGRFAGASGGGQEGGILEDLQAVLGGAPVSMWMEGTITYAPGRAKR